MAFALTAAFFASLVAIPHFWFGLRKDSRGENPIARAIKEKMKGRIASDIPDHMKQGKRETITVRISANTADDLTGDLTAHPVVVAPIAVSPHMTVRLESDGSFDIPPNPNENQFVAADTFTQWQFDVTPRETGKHDLRLEVGMRVSTTRDGVKEDMRLNPTYVRTVMVDVDRVWTLKTFLKDNWKWLMGIVLTVVGFLIKYFFFPGKKAGGEAVADDDIA